MMLGRFISIAITAFLTVSAPLWAQNSLGEAQINGRTIIVNDDFTWSYSQTATQTPSTSDCFAVTGPYSFCGAPLGWTVTNKLSPDAAASFRLDDRNYLAIIREGLGTNDGFSLDFMQEAMVQNLSVAAGLTIQDIPVYSTDDFELFGLPARRVVYGGRISGLDVIYYNTVFVSQAETIQFFSFVIAKEPTPAALQSHTDAVAAFRKG